MLSVDIITTAPELVALRDEWNALMSASEVNELASTPDWILCWWDVFGEDQPSRLCVFTARDGAGRLVGLLPLRMRRHRYRQALPFRRFELLASGEPEKDEIASDYIGLVAAAGLETEVADEFARVLMNGELGPWDELVFTRLRSESTTSAALLRALRGHGADVTTRSLGKCRYATLPSSWKQYLAGLPSRHRYVVRRSLRELDKYSDGDYELCTAQTAEDLDRGLAILIALHDERWTAQGREGVFRSPRFLQFHDEMMVRLLARDALRLHWLEVAGEPIAAVYNIVWDGKVYFYQSGRKMDVPKNLKPGIALHALAMQQAIADGLREYDFLGGDAQYKMQLATGSRELVELRATPRNSFREPVRQITEAGISVLQTWRRRVKHWRPGA